MKSLIIISETLNLNAGGSWEGNNFRFGFGKSENKGCGEIGFQLVAQLELGYHIVALFFSRANFKW